MYAFYDLTRLVERMHALHSTGVDRVDLRYALWLREHSEGIAWGLQQPNGFVLLPSLLADNLLNALNERWFESHQVAVPGGGAETQRYERTKGLKALRAEDFKAGETRVGRIAACAALLEKFRRVGFGEVWKERGLLPAIVSRVSFGSHAAAFPHGEWSGWTYVNIGHCFRFEAAMESIPADMKRLYFLHDVIPLTHPSTQKATSRAHFRKFCEYVGHPMADMIVSSHATVDAIGTLPLSEQRVLESVASIQVRPLAVEERFWSGRLEAVTGAGGHSGEGSEGHAGDVPIRYFLSVGTVEPRKNIELLVEVWEQLSESGGVIPMLIWVGAFGWSYDHQLMRRFERLQQQGHAELRTKVSDSELLELMAGALALLFPSEIEGWGLPLSEALSMNLPVIASDISVFREVGQGVPDLIDPDDAAAWREAILEYSESASALRQAQFARLSNFKVVTWGQHFERLEVFKP